MDVASLKVGDPVGIDPAYGHPYTGVVVKVNKTTVVVEAAGRSITFSMRGVRHGDSGEWRATRLCDVERGRAGELARKCEQAWEKLAVFARFRTSNAVPLSENDMAKLMELVNAIPTEGNQCEASS